MPKLVRLYITQSLWGFVIAALFVAGLLWFDVARLGYLATSTPSGPFAVFLLWAHMGLVFAAVQFAIAVMQLGQGDAPDDDGPRRGWAVPVTLRIKERPTHHPALRTGSEAKVRRRDHTNRRASAFPRTCIYRWAPGNEATTPPEPAPSDLLKATGMLPMSREGQNPPPHNLGVAGAGGKGG